MAVPSAATAGRSTRGCGTQPRFARITAKWYVRGGIYTNVVVEHRKKGWTPQPRVELPAVASLGHAVGLL